MAKLEFKDLSFEEKKDKIIVNFLRIFYTELSKKELEVIGKIKLTKNAIEFQGIPDIKAARKFNLLLGKAFQNLKNKVTNKKAIYIHKNSGIPLIGNISFGC